MGDHEKILKKIFKL